jgi:hypothetical protein
MKSFIIFTPTKQHCDELTAFWAMAQCSLGEAADVSDVLNVFIIWAIIKFG